MADSSVRLIYDPPPVPFNGRKNGNTLINVLASPDVGSFPEALPPRGVSAIFAASPPLPPAGPASSAAGLWAAFFLGLGTRLHVELIGYLPFSELALLCILPFTVSRAYSARNLRKTGWMVPLCFLWLASAIFTDLYQQTQWSLAARGIARAVVYCIAIPQIVLFFSTDGYKKAISFALGTVPSILLSQFIFRGGVIEGRERVYGRAIIDFESHWTVVLGACIMLAILVLYSRSRLLAHALAWAAGIFQITNGSRSAGAVFLLASVVCFLKARFLGKPIRRDVLVTTLWTAFTGLILVVVAFGIYSFYSNAAASGRLGAKAQDKYIKQSGSRFGLLIGGREAVVSGLLAALDSPIVGYGSWPLDREGFYLRTCELSGSKPEPTYYQRGYPMIPTHSHVLCAWVENGIGGLFFWIYVLIFYLRQLIRPVGDERRLGLYLAVAVLSLTWHVLFSPMAGRLEQAVVIALIANNMYFYRLQGLARNLPPIRSHAGLTL